MSGKYNLAIKLGVISKELKEASKLIEKIYPKRIWPDSRNGSQLIGAALMINSWILEIKEEIKKELENEK